jgi:hypothetical protein
MNRAKEAAVTYKNENDIMKALGVDSLANLSEEGRGKLSAMLPDMDRQLAYEVVKQVPEFMRLALGTVDAMQKTAEAAYAHDTQSQARVHDAWEDIRKHLISQADGDDLTWEQKQYYTDLIMETGRQQTAVLTEGRQWSKDIYKLIPTFGYASLLLTMVFIGGAAGIKEMPGGLRKA